MVLVEGKELAFAMPLALFEYCPLSNSSGNCLKKGLERKYVEELFEQCFGDCYLE